MKFFDVGGVWLLDEEAILKLAKRILSRQGYHVLTATTPAEALRIVERHSLELSLLITDVVMPEMDGRKLAQRILSLYPNLKCLYMSGYTADVIAHHGVLDEGINFIQKPFTKKEISLKVRNVLDQKS